MQERALRGVVGLLRRAYFRVPTERKEPVAPLIQVFAVFSIEVITAIVAFSVMVSYFAATPTQITTITSTPIPGQACSVLNPKRGTVYYSKTDSENAQFAKPTNLTTQHCVALLTELDVCGDGQRFDLLNLWGVSNANNSQYFPGGEGYFSFTPTQTPRLTTELVDFYGSTVSFPKPSFGGQTFTGDSTNWDLLNLATPADHLANAIINTRDVDMTGLLYDSATNIVYDSVGQNADFNLSSAVPKFFTSKNGGGHSQEGTVRSMIDGMSSALKVEIASLAVHDNIYYGLIIGAIFNYPSGVSVDLHNNVFVADTNNNLVRRIDAKTGVTTNVGTAADPPFNSPNGIVVDSQGEFLYMADTDSSLLRRIDLRKKTQEVVNIGTSAEPKFTNPFGLAVDNAGAFLYIADTNNDLVRRLDLQTQEVVTLGTSASPPFSQPLGVAVDGSGSVYVADTSNSLVRRIDGTTAIVTNLGLTAYPPFNVPTCVALDATNNVYVVDSGNSAVRRIDAATGLVTTLGMTASPALKFPRSVALGRSGGIYVADANSIRLIDAKSDVVLRLGRLYEARVFSKDLLNRDPLSYTLWPATALLSDSNGNNNITLVDSTTGGCQHLVTGPDVDTNRCYLVSHAEFNAASNRLYVEFFLYKLNQIWGGTYYAALDVSAAHLPTHIVHQGIEDSFNQLILDDPSRQLWGVFQNPNYGIVLYTSQGAKYSIADASGFEVSVRNLTTFNNITDHCKIVDASKIFSQPSRYLMLQVEFAGTIKLIMYDTFTDMITYESQNPPAARTHYMIAYTWGVCDRTVTRGLVEITFSQDYSSQVCKLPSTGMFYQSPNRYYSIPYQCIGLPPESLLTDCPEIKANMKALVDGTCADSIPKVCQEEFDLNPPFACVGHTHFNALTITSLAFSNTNALMSLLMLVSTALLATLHRRYRPTAAEVALSNSRSNHSDHSDSSDKDDKRVDADTEMVVVSSDQFSNQWGKQPSLTRVSTRDEMDALRSECSILRRDVAALQGLVAALARNQPNAHVNTNADAGANAYANVEEDFAPLSTFNPIVRKPKPIPVSVRASESECMRLSFSMSLSEDDGAAIVYSENPLCIGLSGGVSASSVSSVSNATGGSSSSSSSSRAP